MAFGDLPLDAPHKPNKGLEGGACNRQSCQAEPALWFNHGTSSWYCADCRRDIQFDAFNLRDWTARYQPRLGHPMFETREQIDARERRTEARNHFIPASPQKSISLMRILKKGRRRHA
jgi:hypothetical protein